MRLACFIIVSQVVLPTCRAFVLMVVSYRLRCNDGLTFLIERGN